jgi:hypothetical protein
MRTFNVIKIFEDRYGRCEYDIDEELYSPETAFISDMNNYWTCHSLSYIDRALNSVLAEIGEDRKALSRLLDYIFSDVETIEATEYTEKKQIAFLKALVQKNENEVWAYLIKKGVEFSMSDDRKEQIYDCITYLLQQIKEKQLEEKKDTASWVDRVATAPAFDSAVKNKT